MKTGNDIITKIESNIGEPSPQQSLVPTLDADLIDYFFYKISVTWGDGKYWQTFSDEKTLNITKRDWAKDIIASIKTKKFDSESQDEYTFRVKSRIDNVFAEIRKLNGSGKDQNWEWPSLVKIIAYFHKYSVSPAHKPFNPSRAIEDHGKLERNHAAGVKALAEMKEMMGVRDGEPEDIAQEDKELWSEAINDWMSHTIHCQICQRHSLVPEGHKNCPHCGGDKIVITKNQEKQG